MYIKWPVFAEVCSPHVLLVLLLILTEHFWQHVCCVSHNIICYYMQMNIGHQALAGNEVLSCTLEVWFQWSC